MRLVVDSNILVNALPDATSRPARLPDDNDLLALAVAGRANFLVTATSATCSASAPTKARRSSRWGNPHAAWTAAVTAEALSANAAMTPRSVEDPDRLMARIRESAARVHDWTAAQTGDPLEMLRRMKFARVGCRPVENRALNLVERMTRPGRTPRLGT